MSISLDTITKDQVRALIFALLRNHNMQTAANHASDSGTKISPYRSIKWGEFYEKLIRDAGLINEHMAMRGQFLLYAEEIAWELISRGLLVPRAVRNDFSVEKSTELGWSSEAIDDFSKDYLVTPYDPVGYAKHLATLRPNLGSTVIHAMEESIRAFNAKCYASAVVMYGVAAEAIALRVFDVFATSLRDPAHQQQVQKHADSSLLPKLRILREKIPLVAKKHDGLMDNPLKDSWEFGINDLSNVVRQQRNNAGHPELRDNFQHGVVLGFLCAAPHHLFLLAKLEEYFVQNSAMLGW